MVLNSEFSGKFIYVSDAMGGGSVGGISAPLGFGTKSHLRIRRLDPKNGKVMWEYFQERTPLDLKFDRNVIQLVFPKEVQVLTYLAF